jgi:rod shape-determining protein MreC
MENLFTRHRNLSVLAAVLFIQVFGLAVQVKRSNDPQQTRLIRVWAVATITPFEQAIVHTQGAVYGVWHNYLYLRGVRQENRDLKGQIEQLRLEQARLNQDASQARRLQALLGFKEQSILQTMAAQVIGSSGSEQSRSLFLDKGADDGLKKNMAVITAEGVVGKILQTYPHTAQVLLINDQTSGLGAIVERLRLQGIVRGSPNGETMLEKVMADEEVQPGDKVITTGGDGIFPKGLPVGSIVKVSSSDLFLKIRLHPAADLSRLEEVLVITKLQEVAPASGDVAGSQRAVDILAARLPGVPEKPASKDAEVSGAPKGNDPKVDDPKVEDPKVEDPKASQSRPATSSKPKPATDGKPSKATAPTPKPGPPNAGKPQPNETFASPRPAAGPQPKSPQVQSPQVQPTKNLKPPPALRPAADQPTNDRMQ